MTHEHTPNSEAAGGPEAEYTLPSAASIPVADEPHALDPTVWPDEWDDD